MKVSIFACLSALFLSTAAVAIEVPHPRPAGVMKRNAAFSKDSVVGLDRIKRAQVDSKKLREARSVGAFANKDGSFAAMRKRTQTSPIPNVCKYDGPQPDTAQCKQQDTSDGCNSPNYYDVERQTLQLLKDNKFEANGHVNFQYIPLSQYRGYGSKRNPDPSWQVQSAGIHFDPNNNQPGGKFIGKSSLDWAQIANLPAEGYCVIWVQVSKFNSHFGEGGQGPVCYCPKSTRRMLF